MYPISKDSQFKITFIVGWLRPCPPKQSLLFGNVNGAISKLIFARYSKCKESEKTELQGYYDTPI